jgi:hypothetical protein
LVPYVETNTLVANGGWVVPSEMPSEMIFNLNPVAFSMDHEAKPGVSGQETLTALKKFIPGLEGIKTTCPQCKPKEQPAAWTTTGFVSWADGTDLPNVIMHLNDHHHWSREQIADWLDTKDWDLQFATPEGETA